ncbi:MAG: hypothetical protein WA814_11160, partial [Candidatus Baltobacteraceae bacterium]
ANHVTGSAPASASVSPPSLGTFRNGSFFALHPGSGHLVLRSDRLRGDVAVEVSATPARIRITPQRPNVDRNATLELAARAYDASGYALALPASLSWSASSGSIDARGQYHAGSQNANVAVRIGAASAGARVTVGSHEIALPFADHARFATIAAGGDGGLQRNAGCPTCVRLDFSFAGRERAAYAMADIPLPADTIGLTFDLLDDGSAGRVRVALRNAINEETLLDATQLGRQGWRRVIVRFPPDIVPARLSAIYVLPLRGVDLSSGSIVLRNVRAIVGGE